MNLLTKGILFVAFGASSYGMLATFVKLAYKENYSTAEVTISQFALGILIVLLLNIFSKKTALIMSRTDMRNLMLAGTTMGFTSVLYYLCVKYLNASIAVVLLMQSVWIGVLIESLQTRKMPSLLKISAVVLVLAGTALATNIFSNEINFNIKGFVFGFLSAISFSLTLFSTNSVATHLPPFKRTLYMLLGGSVIVVLFALLTQILPTYAHIELINDADLIVHKEFDSRILFNYGILLSVFGTVLPPIFLNKGFPLTGVGLGSIISAIELPVSVSFAYLLLAEQVSGLQWLGILIILFAIILMNYRLIKK